MRLAPAIVVSPLLAFGVALGAAVPSAADAVRLYDEGRYADARQALVTLDAQGGLTGPLLYRLYFCASVAKDRAAAESALDRARKTLESEIVATPSLEVSFYLANTYANMGRPADARDAAARATAKVESGAWPSGTEFMGLFQLAKLYQDQSREDDAVRSYRRALERFDAKSGRYAGNARWALRYVGTVLSSRADFAGAEAAYARLTSLGSALAGDWSALAVARGRLGAWERAAAAWKEAVSLDPDNADDPRYSARLAETAATLAPLPAGAPGGARFKAMSQADLESCLKAQADAVRAVRARIAAATAPPSPDASAKPLDPKALVGFEAELRTIRALFVGAGLEYALRGLPIRETAFREGYAVLVFQDSEWVP